MSGQKVTTYAMVIALVIATAAWLGGPTARADYGAYGECTTGFALPGFDATEVAPENSTVEYRYPGLDPGLEAVEEPSDDELRILDDEHQPGGTENHMLIAWRNHIDRKAAAGAKPMAFQRWKSNYITVIKNRRVGPAFEDYLWNELWKLAGSESAGWIKRTLDQLRNEGVTMPTAVCVKYWPTKAVPEGPGGPGGPGGAASLPLPLGDAPDSPEDQAVRDEIEVALDQSATPAQPPAPRSCAAAETGAHPGSGRPDTGPTTATGTRTATGARTCGSSCPGPASACRTVPTDRHSGACPHTRADTGGADSSTNTSTSTCGPRSGSTGTSTCSPRSGGTSAPAGTCGARRARDRLRGDRFLDPRIAVCHRHSRR